MLNVQRIVIYLLLLLCPVSFAENYSSIPEIHQAMKHGKLTSETLVRFYLTRIDEIDNGKHDLNAISQLNKQAIAKAAELDRIYKKTGPIGPLHGIPVLLKDNIDTLFGMPNTAGSYALLDNFPEDNAFVVKQLEKAGAIILGKTNLSEWANFRSTMSSSGWSGLHGQTKNPYDSTRSPCGSSSGSGVAIAANFATVAIGTETDGSVVCPSAINGIVGIKPTLGTVSREGIIPIASSQDTAGPMARNVTDAVILLSAMVAKDSSDKDALSSSIDYVSHLKADGLKGKRIGVVRNLAGYHKKLDSVFAQALKDISRQGGIIIDDLHIDTKDQWGDPEYEVLLYEFKNELNHYLTNTKGNVPKSLASLIAFNKEHSGKEMPHFAQEIFEMAQAKGDLSTEEYLKAKFRAKDLAQAKGIDALLKAHNVDILIAPTTGPSWKIDLVNGDNFIGSASSAAAISGYPHITVPMGYVEGLPVGLSFFSGKLEEGKLIEAAFNFEQATKHRKPPTLSL